MTNFVVYLSDVLCPRKRPIVIRLLKNDNLLVRFNSFLSSHISSTCTTSRWFLVPSWLLLVKKRVNHVLSILHVWLRLTFPIRACCSMVGIYLIWLVSQVNRHLSKPIRFHSSFRITPSVPKYKAFLVLS